MIPHEITLVAFGRDPDTGDRFVYDIVETSIRNASWFARRFVKDAQVTHLQASRPAPIYALTGAIREIAR